jgi:hypothetical protein
VWDVDEVELAVEGTNPDSFAHLIFNRSARAYDSLPLSMTARRT